MPSSSPPQITHSPGADGKRNIEFQMDTSGGGGGAGAPAGGSAGTIIPPREQSEKLGDLYSGHSEELQRLLFKLIRKTPGVM